MTRLLTISFIERSVPFLTFEGDLVAIRVHRGHDVNADIVDQVCDLWVGTIIGAQVLYQVEHQLSANDLVAVHVGYVLELWLA